MDAHRLGGVEHRGLGGEELRHAGFHVATPAGVVGARGGFGEKTGRLEPGRHLRELDLNRLMLADGLAECLADLRVRDALLEAGTGNAAPARRDVDSAESETSEDLLQAPALHVSDEILFRDLAVVEDQLAGIDSLVTDLLELACDSEAGESPSRR